MVPGDDIHKFTRHLVHPTISHWGLCQSFFEQAVSAFNKIESSLFEPIERTNTDVFHSTEEIQDIISNTQSTQFSPVDMLRWSTVFFWGYPETTQQLGGKQFREDWNRHFIHRPGDSELKVLDVSVLEGLCMAMNKPTSTMQLIISLYDGCSEDDPVLN